MPTTSAKSNQGMDDLIHSLPAVYLLTVMYAAEVTPLTNFYCQHFFAFTPQCSNDCTDNQFGVKSLSSDAGFVSQANVDKSPLPKAIIKARGPLVDDYDVDKYFHINYEASEIQAAVMRANMPLARVIIFCPPCVSAITTGIALCKDREEAVAEWRVRVDHRLGCKCCPNRSSGLARVEMIADTIADVESGNHWADPLGPETNWIEYVDRAWLEQLLYSEDTSVVKTDEHDTDKESHDYAGLRQVLTFDGPARSKTIAVILTDVENGAWIINSESFPVVNRLPRAGEMIHLKRMNCAPNAKPERSFLGTFATKGALKRRREDSSPPETPTS